MLFAVVVLGPYYCSGRMVAGTHHMEHGTFERGMVCSTCIPGQLNCANFPRPRKETTTTRSRKAERDYPKRGEAPTVVEARRRCDHDVKCIHSSLHSIADSSRSFLAVLLPYMGFSVLGHLIQFMVQGKRHHIQCLCFSPRREQSSPLARFARLQGVENSLRKRIQSAVAYFLLGYGKYHTNRCPSFLLE